MRVFELRTKYDELLSLTNDCDAIYQDLHACEGCGGLGANWRASPVAIDLVLRRPPKGSIAAVGGCGLCILRADLAGILAPYFSDLLCGRVKFRNHTPDRKHPGWVGCFPSSGKGIETYRGPYCRHVFCTSGCGGDGNQIGWARGAIVRKDIGKQRAFFGEVARDVYITDDVLSDTDLLARFPDLRPYEFPVVDKPLDGEVLPGDPEWDGVFRPAPPPEFPGDDDPWVER